MSHVLKVLGIALVVGFALHMCGGNNGASRTPHAETAGEKMTREANDKIEAERLDHVHRAVASVKTLKGMMRDPASFQLASVNYMATGDVCIEYRARNGFGGMNAGYAVVPHERDTVMVDGKPETSAQWNARCAKKAGENLTDTVGNYKL